MSKAEKKEVRRAKSSDEMLDMLIGNLHGLAGRAENLATSLEHGKYEPQRRLNRKEVELANLVVVAHLNDVLDEVKFHAAQDNQDDVVNGFEYVTDLMKFKRDL